MSEHRPFDQHPSLHPRPQQNALRDPGARASGSPWQTQHAAASPVRDPLAAIEGARRLALQMEEAERWDGLA